MKNYNNFIFEYFGNIEEQKEMISFLIKRDCEKFLKEGYPMFRGMNLREPIEIIKKFDGNINVTRPPKDTPQHIHKMIGDLFVEKFGWNPRNKGVFATSCYEDATLYNEYGDVYVFMPIGDYKYLYNPSVYDLYRKLTDDGFDTFYNWFEKQKK
ncbi:MAG: hypothetical protein HPY57_14240 [Ignavibacteria bacterium]|nr:hypothetical protein [Ignavibacteria bacterium]